MKFPYIYTSIHNQLESELAELKRNSAEEIAKLKRERDEHCQKIANYESHVKMQNEIIKSWEEKLLKQKYINATETCADKCPN